MSKTVLQVNYKFTENADNITAMNTRIADSLAAVPGLIWKIWLVNEENHEAGGICLFENREAAEEFKYSLELTGFLEHPSISVASVKLFQPVETLPVVTRGLLTMSPPSMVSNSMNPTVIETVVDAYNGYQIG